MANNYTPTVVGGSTVKTLTDRVLEWIEAEVRSGRSNGPTITIGTHKLAAIVGCERHSLVLSLRTLESRGFIDRETFVTKFGASLQNKYTLLPKNQNRLKRITEAAGILGVKRARVLEIIYRLNKEKVDLSVETPRSFASKSEWTGDPMDLIYALTISQIIAGNKLVF